MQTLSSARRTHIAPLSASECTATVKMPISLHARCTRRAISPRLAIRIFSNIALADDRERLAELHGLAILHKDFNDPASLGRRDRVHGFHRLDDHQGLAGCDGVPDLDEYVRTGLRLEVDASHHGRFHHIA